MSASAVYRVTRSQNEVESLSTQLEQIETKATQSAKSSTTLEANLAEAQGRSHGRRWVAGGVDTRPWRVTEVWLDGLS